MRFGVHTLFKHCPAPTQLPSVTQCLPREQSPHAWVPQSTSVSLPSFTPSRQGSLPPAPLDALVVLVVDGPLEVVVAPPAPVELTALVDVDSAFGAVSVGMMFAA